MHALFRDAIESFHLFKKIPDRMTNSRCVCRYNETFKCTKGRAACEVSLVTRKNCQYCRYQKCLAAGMRPSWILSGQQCTCTQLEILMSNVSQQKIFTDEERVRRFHGRASRLGGPGAEKVKRRRGGGGRAEEAADMDTGDTEAAAEAAEAEVSGPGGEGEAVVGVGRLVARVCTQRTDDMPPSLLASLLQVSTVQLSSVHYSTV